MIRRSRSLSRPGVAATRVIVLTLGPSVHAGRLLFDATKGEMAGNADWVIDSDSEVGGHSNPARFPTPAQGNITAGTPETYWKGGISAWGITMVKHGNSVESLPRTGTITYGNTSNPQDLSHYKTFVVCEPNNLFTLVEKTALVNFVKNGGGLFIVADHNNSDRDNDGVDSVDVWNDVFTNNGVASNPFGLSVNANSFSQVSTNLNATAPFKAGTEGTATNLEFNAGASFTISGVAKAAAWTNGSQTNGNVMMAYSTYGLGRIVALGDSSPADDGTGDTGDNLFFGWDEGTNGTLISNATDWLGGPQQTSYDLVTGGSWANAAAWTGVVPDSAGTVVDFLGTISSAATLTLDRAHLAAALRFDSDRSYTIAGTAALTFGDTPLLGVFPGVVVTRGSHTVNVPLVVPFRGEFDVVSATSILTLAKVSAPSSGGLIKDGLGRLRLTQLTGLSALNVIAGSMEWIATDPDATASSVCSLFVDTDATADLGRSALVIDYVLATNSPFAKIEDYVGNERIRTSEPGLVIGYAEAAALGVTSFVGYTPDGVALLLRATRVGDTNLDLAVDFADLVRLAQHYGDPGEWSDGDFNRSGTVDFVDLVGLAQNYGGAASAAVIEGASLNFTTDWAVAQSLVPEPGLAAIVWAPIATWRRRRRVI